MKGFPRWLSGKEFACHGDTGLILGSGRSPGEGNGNELKYSCLGNPVDREAWQAIIHGVTREFDMTSVQSLSRVWLFATPWTAARQASLPITNQSLLKVSDAIQPSHSLLSPSSPTFNLFQHQGFLQWVNSSHQVAKVLEFQLQHQSFQWIFRTDFL